MTRSSLIFSLMADHPRIHPIALAPSFHPASISGGPTSQSTTSWWTLCVRQLRRWSRPESRTGRTSRTPHLTSTTRCLGRRWRGCTAITWSGLVRSERSTIRGMSCYSRVDGNFEGCVFQLHFFLPIVFGSRVMENVWPILTIWNVAVVLMSVVATMKYAEVHMMQWHGNSQ